MNHHFINQFLPDGECTVQFPEAQECSSGETVFPELILLWDTPWCIIDRIYG
jgi:hypothetical protein